MDVNAAIKNIYEILSSDVQYDESIEYQLTTDDVEWLETAKDALQKQVPISIIEETEDDREFIDYVCPNCKTALQQKHKQARQTTIYKYKHCIECGQALKWSV